MKNSVLLFLGCCALTTPSFAFDGRGGVSGGGGTEESKNRIIADFVTTITVLCERGNTLTLEKSELGLFPKEVIAYRCSITKP
jgi:hypothetical protein